MLHQLLKEVRETGNRFDDFAKARGSRRCGGTAPRYRCLIDERVRLLGAMTSRDLVYRGAQVRCYRRVSQTGLLLILHYITINGYLRG